MRALAIIASAGLMISCGVVGSPVAPEYVGVAVTVEKQKRQRALDAERDPAETTGADPFLDEHAVDLPPSHPVGTR